MHQGEGQGCWVGLSHWELGPPQTLAPNEASSFQAGEVLFVVTCGARRVPFPAQEGCPILNWGC